jgi:exopolyphosphatase/guanosine-5'-triphosphate,3'-diphosphate pyrophosphatase
MLVADVKDAQLHRVLRDREGLRVFAALDENGDIDEAMIDKACQSVAAMAKRAREHGAQAVHLFATSAVRDARNQLAFADRLLEATGLRLIVCTGDVEAKLSFLGATGPERSGMIDIGGGSTEIVIGHGEKLEYAESLQMGAVRLHRILPVGTVAEAYAAVERARAILLPEKARILALRPPESWTGGGGTFTTSAALTQDIHWNDRQRIHGYVVSREQITRIMERLAAMPVEQRKKLPGLQPQRADIIVHGLAILFALMEDLYIERIAVSEYGNLEGYLKMAYLS